MFGVLTKNILQGNGGDQCRQIVEIVHEMKIIRSPYSIKTVLYQFSMHSMKICSKHFLMYNIHSVTRKKNVAHTCIMYTKQYFQCSNEN